MLDVKFDFSDTPPVDGVREILDVAVSVLQDYDPEHGFTRIERMARWILLNLREGLKEEHLGLVSVITTSDLRSVQRVDSQIAVSIGSGLATQPPLSAQTARELATGLYLCAQRVEDECP
jgi:hypothetical protein